MRRLDLGRPMGRRGRNVCQPGSITPPTANSVWTNWSAPSPIFGDSELARKSRPTGARRLFSQGLGQVWHSSDERQTHIFPAHNGAIPGQASLCLQQLHEWVFVIRVMMEDDQTLGIG